MRLLSGRTLRGWGAFALTPGAFLLALAASTPATAATIVVGLPADKNGTSCDPFGCNYAPTGEGEYQQVYTNSLFSGPITITGLEFFNTQANANATAMNTGTFAIFLSSTSADWNTLSATAANNIGANNTEVFDGSLSQSWAFGDTLSIEFSTPFTYTPGPTANLLLDIVAAGTGDAGGLIGFDTNGEGPSRSFSANTIFGRLTDDGLLNHGYGLVTGFETTAPEPATFALFGVGLVALQIGRLRRENNFAHHDRK
jgi:hypothetical protein